MWATILYVISLHSICEAASIHSVYRPGSDYRTIPEPDGKLHIYSLPIGQGDAQLIQCPDGELNIYDFGSSNSDSDRFWGPAELKQFFAGSQHLIKNIVLTHNHWDHYRLVEDVFTSSAELSGLENIFISCTANDMATVISDWVTAINGHSLLRTFNGGAACGATGTDCGTMPFCSAEPQIAARVLSANYGQHCTDGGNKNVDCIVTRLEYADFSVLLPGDFEDETTSWSEDGPQKAMVDYWGSDIAVTVAHISHHGASSKANKPVWRDATLPKAVYASGDAWYSYGHPRCAVLDGYIDYVGTLCKPLAPSGDPFYCGPSTYSNAAHGPDDILQTAYTCGLSSTTFDYRTGNDYAIYTNTPDETNLHLIDVWASPGKWGVYVAVNPQPNIKGIQVLPSREDGVHHED